MHAYSSPSIPANRPAPARFAPRHAVGSVMRHALKLAVLFTVCASAARPSAAATIVVDRTDDTASASACTAAANDCSLRGAVTFANANAGTEIDLAPATTYTLSAGTADSAPGLLNNSGGDLDITANVSIKGAGSTINANQKDRIFQIESTSANALTVSIDSLKLINGAPTGNLAAGGAILARGVNLTVSNCEITSSTAATGTNGGGIAVDSVTPVTSTLTFTLSNSTVANNTGGNGGGVILSGVNGVISQDTIAGNTASGYRGGGGIYLQGDGRSLSVSNSTIAGNSASFSGNPGASAAMGGGIYLESTSTGTSLGLSNTILSGNSATYGPDFFGTSSSGDYNLISNTANTLPAGTHNVYNQSAALGTLQNNGGFVSTLALNTGSPAINAGDPAVTGVGQFDERGSGFSRVIGRLDIGAYEAPPTVSIGATSSVEGNTGTGAPGTGTQYLVFPLTLSAASGSPVTVTYNTANGTATAGSDYVAVTNGTATIPAGQTTGSISIAILGDTSYELNETLTVTISAPVGATISNATGLGTITNDDAAPTLSVGDASAKGSAGSMVFTVALSSSTYQTVTVTYATANGTATAGTNYTAASGSLTFTPGQTSKTVTVSGLVTTPSDKTFVLNLTNPSAGTTITKASGTGTILAETPVGTGATDSGVTVLYSGLSRNRTTGHWIQTLVLQNNTGAALGSPLYLVLDNIASNLTLYSPAFNGYTAQTTPLGSPYITLGALAQNASVTVNLEFVNPSNGPVTFQTRVLKGPGTP